MRTRSCSASSSRLVRFDAVAAGLFTPMAFRSAPDSRGVISGCDASAPTSTREPKVPRAGDAITSQCTPALRSGSPAERIQRAKNGETSEIFSRDGGKWSGSRFLRLVVRGCRGLIGKFHQGDFQIEESP